MTRYFGKSSNVERTTLPPEMCRSDKKKKKKSKKNRGRARATWTWCGPSALVWEKAGQKCHLQMLLEAKEESVCWQLRLPPADMATRHLISYISSNNTWIWKIISVEQYSDNILELLVCNENMQWGLVRGSLNVVWCTIDRLREMNL